MLCRNVKMCGYYTSLEMAEDCWKLCGRTPGVRQTQPAQQFDSSDNYFNFIWFEGLQHSGAPAHFAAVILHESLSQHFLGVAHWHLGHYPCHYAALIIPHRTSLRGVGKRQMSAHHCCNSGDLCRALEQVFVLNATSNELLYYWPV